MSTVITLDFPYLHQGKSIRIIKFTSNCIGVIENIPWTILYIFLLPFYLVFIIPFANLILWQFHKKLQKDFRSLKHNMSGISYKSTKKGYDMILELLTLTDSSLQNSSQDANRFLFKGIYNKLRKIAGVFREMQESIAAVLFVKPDATPYSVKEVEILDIMNDIWGNDDDNVYAQNTHYHLTKRVTGNGL